MRRRGLSSLILATRFLPAFSSSSAAFLALLLLTSKALAQTGTVPRGGSDRTVGRNTSFLSKLSDIFHVCGRGIQINQATPFFLFLANYSSIESNCGKDFHLMIYFDICVELSNWKDNVLPHSAKDALS